MGWKFLKKAIIITLFWAGLTVLFSSGVSEPSWKIFSSARVGWGQKLPILHIKKDN